MSAPTPALHPLVDRLARASQDCHWVFDEPTESTIILNGHTTYCTSSKVLHSPGPSAQREQREARLAVQEEANRLLAAGQHDETVALLLSAAEAEHAHLAQYVGHWDQHTLGVALRRTTFKGGTTVERGDALLLGALEQEEWSDRPTWSAYSARKGGDVGGLHERAARRAS